MSDLIDRKDAILLRCPFCGGEAELKQFYPYLSRRIHTVIRCTKCRANSGEWRMKNKAIEAWNTRKPMQNIKERLEEASDLVPVNRLLDDIISDKPKELGQLMAYDEAIKIVKEEGEIE